jgi:hypothetical protein
VTAVVLAFRCARSPLQVQLCTAANVLPAPRVPSSTSGQTSHDSINHDSAAHDSLAASGGAASVGAASGGEASGGADFDACLSQPATAQQPPVPAAAALQDGAHVLIEGLQAAPEMNGRTGIVRGAFNTGIGRWTVQVNADGLRRACCGTFRPSNLKVIPSRDFGTQWMDEEGRVWPKNVDFSRQCAKGHALAPLGDCVGHVGGLQLMCRMCHSFCARESDQSATWMACSVAVSCCCGYAVCGSCARLPRVAPVTGSASADCESFHTQVRCNFYLE